MAEATHDSVHIVRTEDCWFVTDYLPLAEKFAASLHPVMPDRGVGFLPSREVFERAEARLFVKSLRM